MSRYFFNDDHLLIKDYQNTKRFSSFLPMIAGKNGKPLWVFYTNVGQCIASFGVNNKDGAMTPFQSAINAYKDISTTMFRTFIKINTKYYEAFSLQNSQRQTLSIYESKIVLNEEHDDFFITITYATIPHEDYAGLIRHVTIKNKRSQPVTISILDGLPVILPYGLTTANYFNLVTLMASYCKTALHNDSAFYHFSTSIDDSAQVTKQTHGNGSVTYAHNGKKCPLIVDSSLVFPINQSLYNPEEFIKTPSEQILAADQVLENIIPSAFSFHDVQVAGYGQYSFASLYGNFTSQNAFTKVVDSLTYEKLKVMIGDNEQLINDLLPNLTKSADRRFDTYLRQSYLDNGLRGGFPTLLVKQNSQTLYYLYSRKHGDMERDYNFFEVPSIYYSSGEGNYRDVLQNRRSDVYFYPFVGDTNIKMFFELIELNGYNPLVVLPETFRVNESKLAEFSKAMTVDTYSLFLPLVKNFSPHMLYDFLITNKESLFADISELFLDVLNNSTRLPNARFGEGYWIDHWTYLLDLIENYLSIYPDFEEQLLFNETIGFYNSNVQIKSQSRKRFVFESGVVRQLDALVFPSKDSTHKNWVTNKFNEKIHVSLLNKLIHLIILKFLTLDAANQGIEMEANRPGWNDALNGLPGLFGSSFAETIELYRLVVFTVSKLLKYPNNNTQLLTIQYHLFSDFEVYISDTTIHRNSFDAYVRRNQIKEKYWHKISDEIDGHLHKVPTSRVLNVLTLVQNKLDAIIGNVKKMRSDNLVPTYFINEITNYQILATPKVNVLNSKNIPLPLFLEANARLLKLGQHYYSAEMHAALLQTELYDKTFKFYKTAESLDEAPFEIGRIKAFSKGWLERESNFMHMTFKYILGLLKAGLYEQFYESLKTNLPLYFNPETYGRSPYENSSFVVPTNHPNRRLHGQGFFARLTGANAEILEMYTLMFLGPNIFRYENNNLSFVLTPLLSSDFFDANNKVECLLFNRIAITYINESRRNCYEDISLTYEIDGIKYHSVNGQLALDIRNCRYSKIIVYIN